MPSSHTTPPVPSPPVPAEEGVFIDYGAEVPEAYAGRRLRVMAQDAHTLFVYWEPDGAQGPWTVQALDRQGAVLASFETGLPQKGGWLRTPVHQVGAVRVQGADGAVLALDLAAAEVGAPATGAPERWVQAGQAPAPAVAAPVAPGVHLPAPVPAAKHTGGHLPRGIKSGAAGQ